jgi:hypothetical protein
MGKAGFNLDHDHKVSDVLRSSSSPLGVESLDRPSGEPLGSSFTSVIRGDGWAVQQLPAKG